MIFSLIKYWQPLAAALLTLFLSYGLHKLDMSFVERAKQHALDEQKAMLIAACETDKQKTKEANDALQKSAHDIAGKLAAYKRLHPSSCVPVAGVAQPAPRGAGHAGEDGISSDWLREYAAECEAYRQQRIILEEFGESLR